MVGKTSSIVFLVTPDRGLGIKRRFNRYIKNVGKSQPEITSISLRRKLCITLCKKVNDYLIFDCSAIFMDTQ